MEGVLPASPATHAAPHIGDGEKKKTTKKRASTTCIAETTASENDKNASSNATIPLKKKRLNPDGTPVVAIRKKAAKKSVSSSDDNNLTNASATRVIKKRSKKTGSVAATTDAGESSSNTIVQPSVQTVSSSMAIDAQPKKSMQELHVANFYDSDSDSSDDDQDDDLTASAHLRRRMSTITRPPPSPIAGNVIQTEQPSETAKENEMMDTSSHAAIDTPTMLFPPKIDQQQTVIRKPVATHQTPPRTLNVTPSHAASSPSVATTTTSSASSDENETDVMQNILDYFYKHSTMENTKLLPSICFVDKLFEAMFGSDLRDDNALLNGVESNDLLRKVIRNLSLENFSKLISPDFNIHDNPIIFLFAIYHQMNDLASKIDGLFWPILHVFISLVQEKLLDPSDFGKTAIVTSTVLEKINTACLIFPTLSSHRSSSSSNHGGSNKKRHGMDDAASNSFAPEMNGASSLNGSSSINIEPPSQPQNIWQQMSLYINSLQQSSPNLPRKNASVGGASGPNTITREYILSVFASAISVLQFFLWNMVAFSPIAISLQSRSQQYKKNDMFAHYEQFLQKCIIMHSCLTFYFTDCMSSVLVNFMASSLKEYRSKTPFIAASSEDHGGNIELLNILKPIPEKFASSPQVELVKKSLKESLLQTLGIAPMTIISAGSSNENPHNGINFGIMSFDCFPNQKLIVNRTVLSLINDRMPPSSNASLSGRHDYGIKQGNVTANHSESIIFNIDMSTLLQSRPITTPSIIFDDLKKNDANLAMLIAKSLSFRSLYQERYEKQEFKHPSEEATFQYLSKILLKDDPSSLQRLQMCSPLFKQKFLAHLTEHASNRTETNSIMKLLLSQMNNFDMRKSNDQFLFDFETDFNHKVRAITCNYDDFGHDATLQERDCNSSTPTHKNAINSRLSPLHFYLYDAQKMSEIIFDTEDRQGMLENFKIFDMTAEHDDTSLVYGAVSSLWVCTLNGGMPFTVQ